MNLAKTYSSQPVGQTTIYREWGLPTLRRTPEYRRGKNQITQMRLYNAATIGTGCCHPTCFNYFHSPVQPCSPPAWRACALHRYRCRGGVGMCWGYAKLYTWVWK